MTEQEKTEFIRRGREGITALAYAVRALAEWSESFEQRGGQATYGDDALLMVYISNDLQTWLTTERRATIARLRSDI